MYQEEVVTDVVFGEPTITITKKNNPFLYGLHKVCAVVTMIIELLEPVIKTTECGYVDIVATPLSAILVGGVRVQASIELNVRLSLIRHHII